MNNSALPLSFPLLDRKEICANFDGGEMTSDAGLLFLAQADRKLRLIEQLATQIYDPREPGKVRHSIEDLLRERIFALCAGYEDANDLDTLKCDPALLLSCGKPLREGEALASQPTMSRLENRVDRKDLFCLAHELARIVIVHLPPNTGKSVSIRTSIPTESERRFRFNLNGDSGAIRTLLGSTC